MNQLGETVHPTYARLARLWERWQHSYHGEAAYTAARLASHRQENEGDYRDRARRATLLNYVRPICDTYANYLFRPRWTIATPPELAFITSDADGRGTSCEDFFKSLVPLAAAVGYALIGVDEPPADADDPPRNQRERRERGVRPYLFYVSPLDLLDWEIDARGNLTAALIREDLRGVRPVGGAAREGRERYVYRLWRPESIVLRDAGGEVLDERENRAGCVPLTSLKFRDVGDPVVGQGLGQDLEPVQADILNVLSLLSEIFYRQTFSQLVAPGHPEDFNAEGDIARIGTSTIFTFDPESRHAPHFISPDAGQAELLMAHVDRSIDEMYRLANLQRGSVREGTRQSGVAKAYDFMDSNQALADVARNTATAMRQALGHAAAWVGADEAAIRVAPPADFGIVDLDGDVRRLQALRQAGADAALIEALERRLARALAPEIHDEHAKEVRT